MAKINPLELKTELQCSGVKVASSIQVQIEKITGQEMGSTLQIERASGAGPSGGKYILLPGEVCLEISLVQRFTHSSPFILKSDDEEWFIEKEESGLRLPIRFIPQPNFYRKYTSKGIPMYKVALLHGVDCLATTVNPACYYWRIKKQCKFCGIEVPLRTKRSIGRKHPDQFIEVLDEALKEKFCRHITLTSGTRNTPDKGALDYVHFVKAIKEFANVPTYVQVPPPKDFKYFDLLADVGVDSIGIHAESFDQNILMEICPGKFADADLDRYFEAWKYCVRLFGENQVSTFILIGLGESDSVVLNGTEKLAQMGVITFLAPHIPVLGSTLENSTPPSSRRMLKLYRSTAEIMKKYGLNPSRIKAGCTVCSACGGLQDSFYKDFEIET
ncbi:MAG: radical SAM protein [Candidatus Bathyarchaeia archaeon]